MEDLSAFLNFSFIKGVELSHLPFLHLPSDLPNFGVRESPLLALFLILSFIAPVAAPLVPPLLWCCGDFVTFSVLCVWTLGDLRRALGSLGVPSCLVDLY